MLCLVVALVCLAATQGCSEPHTMVHIQNYDGPIILHSSTCDHQHCNPSNQNNNKNQNRHCESDCTCVSRQSYNPYNTQCYPTTNYGYCNQCCNDEPKVYPVMDNGYSSYGNCNRYGNNNYQCHCSGYYSR